jgi:hypothetical protein
MSIPRTSDRARRADAAIMLAIGVTILGGPYARAASPGESVDDLIKRGSQLRLQNKPAAALELFERAHAVAPSPRTLGQIGLAEEALGRWVEAFDHLTGALAASDDPFVKKNRAALESGLSYVRRQVGEIVVTGPAGVDVFVDGKRVGTLPLARAIRAPAGHVVMRAVSSDYEPFATTIDVIGGGHTALTLALTSAQSAIASPVEPVTPPQARPSLRPTAVPMLPAAPPVVPPAPGRTWKTPVGAALGVAGLGLVAWGTVWIAIDGHANGTNSAGDQVGYSTKTAGWIMAGAGAAAAIAGGVLIYTDKSGPSQMALGLRPGGLLLAGMF